MSTIVTDTITGKSTATTITIGSTPVVSASANSMTIRGEGSAQTSIQQGLAKMWFYRITDGSSLADSFNASSITDTGTGDFSVVFSNNMNNASYGTGKGSTVAYDGQTSASGEQLAGIESSSLRIKMYQNGSISDAVCLGSIHGDLA